MKLQKIMDNILLKPNYLVSSSDNYNETILDKLNSLNSYLVNLIHDGIIIAFSGGTDSAMLLWAVKSIQKKIGGNLLAITQDSPSLPRNDLEEAIVFAKILEVEHQIVKSKEFSNPDYIKNDKNRCYYCRKELFKITDLITVRDGYKHVLYGYNSSDKTDYRPGHKAALESNVLSPLAELGFEKNDIRTVLRNNNISLADKPATPCLSSRVMTGIPIEEKHLKNIESIEKILWNAGAKVFRVRLCKEKNDFFIRIESSESDLQTVLDYKKEIIKMGKSFGYKWITLDLEGYKLGGGMQ